MSTPAVIIVDDDPGGGANTIAGNLGRRGLRAEVIPPERLTLAHLIEADLILVDYALERWVEPRDEAIVERSPNEQLIAGRPSNGLALAAVIRSLLPEDDRLRGIALLSAQLHELIQDFSQSVTEHAAARINGIEWAFDKNAIAVLPDLSERIKSFAQALGTLQSDWRDEAEDPEAALVRLLALDSVSEWSDVALRDVHAAQPPINQFAKASHGLSVLRWLAQRILPYPTFLLDDRRLTMACGIDLRELDDQLDARELEAVFGAYRYRGPLSEFLGPRWWRAGIRQELRQGVSDTVPSVATAQFVSSRIGRSLRALDPPTSVLAIDAELNPTGAIARERAVRVRPDDWPAFAETGWMDREIVRGDAALIDLVDPADRALVED